MSEEEKVTELVDSTKEEENTEEEDVEPQFICGLVIRMLPDGQGLNLQPLNPEENKEFARFPSADDLLIMATLLDQHIRSVNLTGRIAGAIEEQLKNFFVQLQATRGGRRQ